MIPILFERPPWTPADKEALSLFLASVSGQRAVGRLAYSRPEYKTTLSIEERAIVSAKMEGFEAAVTELLKLTTVSDNG
ncbi:MAG: hypothetical protein EBR82_21555 [Caulobacteraceae bacterium]|nr:hypothetical protein [Caulobacteraceae bacterium]